MLHALADLVGEDRLFPALRAYAIAWRFKHPSPWDFMASMETALAESLGEFWLSWLFSAEGIDPDR
jgi:aminopeptidase N